jgi:hypothetical protein
MIPVGNTVPILGRFLSTAALRVPRLVVESAWLEHGPFAAWLIEATRPALLVELGVHNGYSYAAFCEAVILAGLYTRCVGIDTWTGDEHSGFYGEDVLDRLRAHHDPIYATFSTLLRSTFADAVGRFADGSIDLLHIDGRHRYKDVVEDFSMWRPKLSTRAIVLFHDTEVQERDFGVHRFWRELSRDHKHFNFEHGNGLGVLAAGAEIPPAIAPLFDLSASDGAAVRALYGRLGAAIALIFQWQQTRKALDEANVRIGNLRQSMIATNIAATKR